LKVPTSVVLAVAAVGLAAGCGGGGGGGGKDSTQTTQSTAKPAAVSETALHALAGALLRPVYWAGPRPGITYELTQVANGQIYLRYLSKGVKVGARRPQLTIGTYPLKDALAVTDRLSKKRGEVRIPLPGGGVAAYSRAHPMNVYLAYPLSDYQIEVFDPVAGDARRLVVTGRVTPIRPPGASGAAPKPFVETLPAAGLKALAHSLGRPVYWVGPQPRTTYQVTQTPDGDVYLRYLPRGLGAGEPPLTVGTYPVSNAFAVTQRIAEEKGSVRIPIAGKGLAVYRPSDVSSVYLAYPGVNYQVEVYDPGPERARRLVASGRVTPVG
jgi:hypothetical protein